MIKDNEFVAMGQHLCSICGSEHDSGEILFHKQLRNIPEDKRLTGYGTCPTCKDLMDQGYVQLIEYDPKLSKVPEGTTMQPSETHRTGEIHSLKVEAFNRLFNIEAPEGMVCFVEKGICQRLDELAKLAINDVDASDDGEVDSG